MPNNRHISTWVEDNVLNDQSILTLVYQTLHITKIISQICLQYYQMFSLLSKIQFVLFSYYL